MIKSYPLIIFHHDFIFHLSFFIFIFQAVGGRGGGKPGLAQGSVGSPDKTKLAAALKEAQNYLDTISVKI